MTGRSSCSESARMVARALLASACMLALACAPASQHVLPPVPPGDTLATGAVEGEYGLWVEDAGDSVVVHWLTAAPRPDTLVVHRGSSTDRYATPAAVAHRVTFAAPGSTPLTLQYGRATTTLWPGVPAQPPLRAEGVDSVFVVGDVHGELNNLVGVLRHAGVVDRRLRWAAGRSHLVLLGDLVDRGVDATRVLWLVYDLEHQAAAAGGSVDMVLGNHETMIFQNDLRYTSGEERALATFYGVTYPRLYDIRGSLLGRWLASKPPALIVDSVLFAHGGIAPDYLGWSLEALRDTLGALLRSDAFYLSADSAAGQPADSAARARIDRFVNDDRSIFWFRGYVQSDSLEEPLRRVLTHFGARALVVGHTPLKSIQVRYGGRLIAANTFPFAAELLLIVRKRGGLEAWRYRASGPAEPLGPIGAEPVSAR